MSPEEAAALVPVLEEQEGRLALAAFDNNVAWELGGILVELARQSQAPVAIDVSAGEQCLFHCGLAGSCADNDAWIQRKRRVVARYGESSYLVGTRFRARGTTFEQSSLLDPGEYAAHGGAFPLRLAGSGKLVVGTAAVSGLPQAEDHAMVVAALEVLVMGGH